MGDKIKQFVLILASGIALIAPTLYLFSNEMQKGIQNSLTGLISKFPQDLSNLSKMLTVIFSASSAFLAFALLSYGLCKVQAMPSHALKRIARREIAVKTWNNSGL